MKKIIITALLALASLPAFSRDNSASAWEFRHKTCSFIGEVAASGRMAAIDGKSEPVWGEEAMKGNALGDEGQCLLSA